MRFAKGLERASVIHRVFCTGFLHPHSCHSNIVGENAHTPQTNRARTAEPVLQGGAENRSHVGGPVHNRRCHLGSHLYNIHGSFIRPPHRATLLRCWAWNYHNCRDFKVFQLPTKSLDFLLLHAKLPMVSFSPHEAVFIEEISTQRLRSYKRSPLLGYYVVVITCTKRIWRSFS